MPEDRRRQLLDSAPLTRFTEATITDLDMLEHQLKEIAGRGWASAVEELEPGFVAVGAALLSPWGEAVGALSIGGPVNRLDDERLTVLGERLRDAVEEAGQIAAS